MRKKPRRPAVVPVIDNVRVLDEFAFICEGTEEGVDLRAVHLNQPDLDESFSTLAKRDFNPGCAVKLSKGSAGILHFFGVNYVNGAYDVIATNTVFPEALTRIDYDPRSIAFSELCRRATTAKPPCVEFFEL